MLKKGDVDDDSDDENEVRTTVPQNCVTATLSTEEYFFRTQYLYISVSVFIYLPSYEQRGAGGGAGGVRRSKLYSYVL
jgi:hypothetical protein